ncbi:MAG: UDP-glucose 4-epimerase GalE [Chloroflexi bacterium GWB2_49_20]|nr:MAG: UDP-glucose 4-epimerase GalE [Chloroflexi bacterium GWB2_49_20]OGN77269.1 MAG: UDP-glucose 4-epimerase GalE [Chloroflexi bacterium GWC2_49_37]OGN84734.1 MAG: UDP-glucose 4-epimerase GalE [Chloroflexi bacterium GWD2_49_16]HBG75103.1 UDP-glucose 4-epimerase GalE [Anaerolineae bacterium]HCC78454.1 UDP-glucose 4-epimerase GalE [Anaerolineae bacterium]
MNIFVTGGAGYIGSAMTEALLNAGHTVTVYDALYTGHRQAIPDGARFVHADMADDERLTVELDSEPYDAVMHFAAFIEAGESMKKPGKFIHNNLVNSAHLIEASLRAGVRRFVLSSTAAVYASSDEPLDETSPLDPANTYGFTKLAIEQMLEWYCKIHGMHYAALRYFNAAGAVPGKGEAHHPESHLIPLVLRVPLGQSPNISIYGTDYPTPDGTNIRDYIHIADLVSAHLLALDALGEHDRLVYNLGNGNGYSVREVIETARRVTNHPIPVLETGRRAGDASRLVASSGKIRRELGWEPKFPELQDIITSAWEWHSAHPHGYS